MTDFQEQVLNLLTSIYEKLETIESNTSYITYIDSECEKINSKLDEIVSKFEEE